MPIQVTSDNLTVSESMKVLATDKLSKLLSKINENTPEDLVDVRVVLNKGSAVDTFDVKVEFNLAGTNIIGKSTEYRLETAVIDAVEDALRQFNKEKDIRNEKDWEEARKMKVVSEEEMVEDLE